MTHGANESAKNLKRMPSLIPPLAIIPQMTRSWLPFNAFHIRCHPGCTIRRVWRPCKLRAILRVEPQPWGTLYHNMAIKRPQWVLWVLKCWDSPATDGEVVLVLTRSASSKGHDTQADRDRAGWTSLRRSWGLGSGLISGCRKIYGKSAVKFINSMKHGSEAFLSGISDRSKNTISIPNNKSSH